MVPTPSRPQPPTGTLSTVRVTVTNWRTASAPCPTGATPIVIIPDSVGTIPIVSSLFTVIPPTAIVSWRPFPRWVSGRACIVSWYVGVDVGRSRPASSASVSVVGEVVVTVLRWRWSRRQPSVRRRPPVGISVPPWSPAVVRPVTVPMVVRMPSVRTWCVAIATAATEALGTLFVSPYTNGTSLRGGWESSLPVVELPTVQLVAVLEVGDVFGSCRVGRVLEVGVLEGIHGIYPCPPIQLHELLKQRDGQPTMVPEAVLQVTRPRSGGERLGARQLFPAGHVLVGRRANKVEDDIKLMTVALAREDRLPNQHLSEDTAGTS